MRKRDAMRNCIKQDVRFLIVGKSASRDTIKRVAPAFKIVK